MVVCEKCSTTRLGRLTNPICTSQVLTHFLRMVKSMACASSTGLMESFGTRKNVTAVNCAGRENFGTGGFRKTKQHLTFSLQVQKRAAEMVRPLRRGQSGSWGVQMVAFKWTGTPALA